MTSPNACRWRLALELLMFQAAWFACVLGAAHHQAVLGMLAVAMVIGVHWGLSDKPSAELASIVIAVVLGLAWDTLMARCGLVSYASPEPSPDWAPPWILALWALFATLLREPLRWLHGRRMLAALLGAVGGPVSYASAIRLGAGHFADTPLALAALAAGWAVMTPALIEAAHWFDAHAPGDAIGRTTSVAD